MALHCTSLQPVIVDALKAALQSAHKNQEQARSFGMLVCCSKYQPQLVTHCEHAND
jgi:hypothetical protein